MAKIEVKNNSNVLKAVDGRFVIMAAVNGVDKQFSAGPSETLLAMLRREGYKGVKKGCDTGDCGTCAVLVNGKAVLSCLMLAAQAHGTSVTTIEGLGTPNNPHPIQKAFVDTGAVQCGFCIPGMILTAKELLDKNPDPEEAEIRFALDGNLCRCTGYVKQIEAVKLAAEYLNGRSK